jgi:hypothetical protein
MPVNTCYYPHLIHEHGRDLAVLWHEGEDDGSDGLMLTADGLVATYPDLRELQWFAQANRLLLATGDPSALDLDAVRAWLAGPSKAPIDCPLLLDAWNFLSDVANSVGALLNDRGKVKDRVYGKLFYGNNLPAVTPPGEHYTPAWSVQERTVLGRVLSQGLSIWQRYHQPPPRT